MYGYPWQKDCGGAAQFYNLPLIALFFTAPLPILKNKSMVTMLQGSWESITK
jgi:hypothetical protein